MRTEYDQAFVSCHVRLPLERQADIDATRDVLRRNREIAALDLHAVTTAQIAKPANHVVERNVLEFYADAACAGRLAALQGCIQDRVRAAFVSTMTTSDWPAGKPVDLARCPRRATATFSGRSSASDRSHTVDARLQAFLSAIKWASRLQNTAVRTRTKTPAASTDICSRLSSRIEPVFHWSSALIWILLLTLSSS